ncbi:MAG: uracil-DNA glycosylase [Syntrophomonadaceae bacterium]|nr:uracil-DNA glycosylase [Syntrophomonadaceae bacterium]
MSVEQPDLFGIEPAMDKPAEPEKKPLRQETEPFLPGVRVEAAFPHVYKLEELAALAVNCQACRLRSTCQQVVFGEGDPDSKIMFIGEGPGQDEDIQGRPFVGRAGQLLNKILEAAEFSRPDVYIGNVVKCRPPGNRIPNPDEVQICRNYLEAQIRIIKPSIIVCLGAAACKAVIDPKAKISVIRGKWFMRQGIKIMATYHPAALLRTEAYKRPTWEDFKLIRDEYKGL